METVHTALTAELYVRAVPRSHYFGEQIVVQTSWHKLKQSSNMLTMGFQFQQGSLSMSQLSNWIMINRRKDSFEFQSALLYMMVVDLDDDCGGSRCT
jgi:hypothetical protein